MKGLFDEYGNGIFLIDSGYEFPRATGVFVIKTAEGAMIVETAHAASLSRTEAALDELGVSPEEVRYIFVTHVHLDHAGGAGAYMERFSSAKLVVHSRGAYHMAHPQKLWSSARAVYGDEIMEKTFGPAKPIDPSRIVEASDGMEIELGGRSMICLDTPGHAKHHISYHLRDASSVFTGDVFGMCFDGLSTERRHGLVATTSPVQFDPDAMHSSVDRIAALKPSRLLLTHYGAVTDVEAAAEDMHLMINGHVRAAQEGAGDFDATLRAVETLFDRERIRQSWPFDSENVEEWTRLVIDMNAKGLVHWYNNSLRNISA